MTVEEVQQQKALLRRWAQDEAQKFTQETGALVEIRVTYRRVNVDTYGASDPPRWPPAGFYESTVEVTV